MSAVFDVYAPDAWGGSLRSFNGVEWVELWRKEPTPPFATVKALSLTNALHAARLLYGRGVIVAERGVCSTTTTLAAVAPPRAETPQ